MAVDSGILAEDDIRALLQAALDLRRRVQRVELTDRAVWLKRHGTERTLVGAHCQRVLAAILPFAFLRPSPRLSAEDMVRRERAQIEAFRHSGFATPQIVCALGNMLVLSDMGESVAARLTQISGDAEACKALLSRCAHELGRVHAAGLCHGRPHPRDMFFAGERIGFLDFEEDPAAVMPLATAQARDIWLLALHIAPLGASAVEAAYSVWRSVAPAAAAEELRKMVQTMRPFLPVAQAIHRFATAKDVYRFAIATHALLLLVTADFDPGLLP
ncbi:serine/threonine protein phosphatase [Phyllobacterium sp. 0TCS1.6C]|uniref:serine/threonine protein phosphatase n=1 Tax=unclassified Phyllobacterium TaxID=2638441 RepID=UPI0022651319|nr:MULTISPECIES: serine/threonine protein phosphatase [unclassified Phyllobacterium]MCX8280460.1 serine/threonine protein phosphatase [Phyllobacterium sp. 0TCS1.6C]MCX8295091.1 serine/threonine protein phosphatase [Phyllobacterium sp. 0TCS1.6A]